MSDRLEASRQQTQDLKRSQELLQGRVEQLQAEVQRSESRANQLDLQLQSSRQQLESGDAGADNYLREELGRLRRESSAAQDKVKELRKTVSFLETEKVELERRAQLGAGPSPYGAAPSPYGAATAAAYDQPDSGRVSRNQIPLLSSSSAAAAAAAHARESGESAVKLRIMEQENERLVKKIRGLETQLQELERAHGDRIQELLKERRRERDRENARQKEALKHVEGSLASRERIYKDRIAALEQQVDALKEQLAKELRRRQVFISSESSYICKSSICVPAYVHTRTSTDSFFCDLKALRASAARCPSSGRTWTSPC